MGLGSEMKNLSEEILASFKQRIKENEELVNDVQKTLDGFRKDHQEMAAALRASLAKDEKNRLKEADILMEKITKEHKDMAAALRAGLDKGEKNRLKEFDALMKSINEKISEIFTFTHDLLAKFDKEHLEMSVELRKNLSDGEVERLKEFNVVMKGIQNDVKNLKKAVAGLLGDYAQDRGEASAAWKKMSDILAQLRKTAVTPPKQVVRKVEKKEVKKETPAKAVKEVPIEAVKEIPVEAVKEVPIETVKETPVEAVKEIPVEVQPKVEPKPVVPMTLKEKVLDYINTYPKGVKVSEMEKPLGETRMRLGIVAKNLLDEGKVKKIDNIYFPLS